jgi:hypothetical protein
VSVNRAEVRQAITRMVGVWPGLGKRDVLRQEIGEAIMRHADKVQPSDLDEGVRLLITTARTRQDDGGPAQPPGPRDVVGCILSARHDRVERLRDAAPRKDARAGLTFGEWWDMLPEDQQAQHATLRAMMGRGDG